MIRERTRNTREMPAQDRWASIRAAWAQIEYNMQYQFTYPHELFTDLLQMFVQMLVFRQVWIALYVGREAYAGQEAHAGVTLAQAVTYQLVNTILQLKLKSLQAQLAYPANFCMQIASVALIGFLGIPALLLLTTAFPSIGGWDFTMLGFMVALKNMAHGIHHGLFFSFATIARWSETASLIACSSGPFTRCSRLWPAVSTCLLSGSFCPVWCS